MVYPPKTKPKDKMPVCFLEYGTDLDEPCMFNYRQSVVDLICSNFHEDDHATIKRVLKRDKMVHMISVAVHSIEYTQKKNDNEELVDDLTSPVGIKTY